MSSPGRRQTGASPSPHGLLHVQTTSPMTIELELSTSESPSDFETTAEDLLLSTSLPTTTGSISPNPLVQRSPALSGPAELSPQPPPGPPLEDQQLDLQGIPWARANVTRDQFRMNRMAAYSLYEADRGYRTCWDCPELEWNKTSYYRFKYMNRFEGCGVQHFQLKHLVHAPSPMSCIFPLFNRVKLFNPLHPDTPSRTILNVSETFGAGFSRISSLSASSDLVVIGGLLGELVITRWPDGQPSLRIISPDPANAVVNHIVNDQPNSNRFLCSCNDGYLRIFNVECPEKRTQLKCPWAVNASSPHPASPFIVSVVGDGPAALILDTRIPSSTPVCAFSNGHLDYSFSAAWRPDGLHLATANQDRTVIVTDWRRPQQPFSRFRCRMSVPRSLKYHPDGLYLFVAEADDFVHIVDSAEYKSVQTIDFFGDIAGIDVSVGCGRDRLFIACSNPHQGGLICFER